MLRLNMAVPVTPRTSADFSSLGIVKAAVLGLTDSRFNTGQGIQNIPNMDGFPNGRRLEDDVTTIELQAVSGVALAAIGLWYDDYIPGTTPSPVTPNLLSVLSFNAGVTHNDTTFQACMPYEQQPWRAFNGANYSGPLAIGNLNLSAPLAAMVAFPNPFVGSVAFRYKLADAGNVRISVVDVTGRLVKVIDEGRVNQGEYSTSVNAGDLTPGNYIATLSVNNVPVNVAKIVKTK
jgi:hypothetical protein